LDLLGQQFDIHGLLDMKKIIFRAMQLEDLGTFGKDSALIRGATVTVDNRKSSNLPTRSLD
jgi:hypothetical protein